VNYGMAAFLPHLVTGAIRTDRASAGESSRMKGRFLSNCCLTGTAVGNFY
jgi:hypothetical protein